MKQQKKTKQFFQNKKTTALLRQRQQDRQKETNQHIKRSGKYLKSYHADQFTGSFKKFFLSIRYPKRDNIQSISQKNISVNFMQLLTSTSIIVVVLMLFFYKNESREIDLYEAWNILNSAKNNSVQVIHLALERLNKYNYNLSEIDLSKINLKNINLREADLEQVNFSGANLKQADLKRANLFNANLNNTKLQFANLEETLLMKADLKEANLALTNLKRADLWGANLIKADLSGANLREADLIEVDLTGANLVEADLTGARLRRANLTGANLTGVNLTNVDLKGAILDSTNLDTSTLVKTNLEKTNLEDLKLSSFNSKTIFPKNVRSEAKDLIKTKSLIQNTDNHSVWWGVLFDSEKNKTDLRYEVSFKDGSLNILLAPYGITPIHLENIEFNGTELSFSLPAKKLLQCELQRQINNKYIGHCHNAENQVLEIRMAPSFREKTLKGSNLAPTETDLQILQRALEILHDESVWHKTDERVCDDDKKQDSWSMFCGLYQASLDVTSKYLHQRPAMKEVRKVIKDITNNRPFEHQIKDYNNMQETSFNDVINILEIAKEQISKEIR
ncbi:MAG: pentapeptide repeat-containing protein [Pleurocapsa sp. MO_226.B13]|nr:pentapeptide repeat-containing protein [Pleurocapsa sp. MO_226.B13]